MSRGDEKHGKSSHESNRSRPPFTGKTKHSNSHYNKRHSTSLSGSQQPRIGSDADRNRDGNCEQESRSHHADGKNFNILADNVPYMVSAARFKFNGEARYKVTFNGSSEHVFTWDSSLGQLRAIDDEASTMPDNLEMAISEKLQAGM